MAAGGSALSGSNNAMERSTKSSIARCGRQVWGGIQRHINLTDVRELDRCCVILALHIVQFIVPSLFETL
jgi:hypothetical protein